MNVYQRLNAARKKFHELKLTKTGENKFAGYKYFELGDFLIPGLQVFDEAGLCATVSFPNGTATMTVRNIEKPDETIIFESPMGSAALKGCHEVQNIGAVETYQRRYLWVAALEIVEHDALDATTGKAEPEKPARARVQPPKRGAHADVMATSPAIDDETMAYLNELADRICVCFDASGEEEGPKAAYHLIAAENLDDIQKIYLSSVLPSGVRNPIKAYSQSLHATKRAKEHA